MPLSELSYCLHNHCYRKRPCRCRPAGGQRERFYSVHYKIQHEVFGVSVEFRTRVSRKRAFFARTSFFHKPSRSAFSKGFGLLTAHRVRDIRFPLSWRPASAENGRGKTGWPKAADVVIDVV